MKLRTKTWLAVTASAGLVLSGVSPALATGTAGRTEHTDMGVTGTDVMKHLQAISDISTKHSADGFRSLGSPGYEEAVEYVEKTLEATGAFDVERQAFDVEDQTFGEVAVSVDDQSLDVTPASYTEGTSEPLTDLPLVLPVDDDHSDLAGGQLGCEASDYDDSAQGAVVLVARGECAFGQKAQAATDAGAAAVIIYNNDTNAPDENLNATLGERIENGAPTVTVSYNAGSGLVDTIEQAPEGQAPSTDFTLETEFVTTTTWNVIAETKAGDHDNVQMFGAHLDGVPEGPGVNDNGSGSAALLASAEALAKQPTEVDNAIRFGWWGAEEVGLVGSTEYVASLSDAEVDKIKAYLNFDMIGSDNYVVGTLDSNGSDVPIPGDVTVPEGSAELEKIYTDYFDGIDQKHVGTDFSGRSDYKAFMDAGIPASGLFSGADGVKTEQEAEWFGGTVGQPHDTNYHKPSDTIENVSRESVDIFAPAIAYSVHALAYELREKPTEDPTDDPDPTEDPTDDPTDKPTDDPGEDPGERTLTIEPKTIGVDDFVSDKGVQVTATGCVPGSMATMTVKAKSGKIEKFEQTAEANAEGVAQFSVRGLDKSQAETYVGTYDVKVKCKGGGALKGSFEVVAEDSENPNAGGTLPRTGDEALPLVISAGALIALGVAMTMGARRRKG
ncbi:M28 family peptidase [Brevibacterium sp.]|uniref:M28 family peptidase n=1 Tax=Brevibacterium sp. TaxID=1701 RepID=UPI002811F826|nr:M28 family peptidase [Brevibacterium sp.]